MTLDQTSTPIVTHLWDEINTQIHAVGNAQSLSPEDE